MAFITSLLSLFDFSGSGHISRDNWRRGTKSLHLGSMGDDDQLWGILLQAYDPDSTGVVHLSELQGLVSIDPRMHLLLNAMVSTMSALTQQVERQEKKIAHDAEMAQSRALIRVRRRVLEPVVRAWAEAVQRERKAKHKATRHAHALMYGRAWRQLTDLCEERWRVARYARRLSRGAVARAWRAWCERTDEARTMAKFGRRMMNSGLARLWVRWMDQAEERRRMQAFSRRMWQSGVGAPRRGSNHRVLPVICPKRITEITAFDP